MKKQTDMEVTRSASSDASFLRRLFGALLLSVPLKAMTFTLTTIFTRRVTPEIRGMVFFMDLYGDSVGFLAKEAVRNAALRTPLHAGDTEKTNSRVVLRDVLCMFNTAAFVVPLTILMIGLFEAVAMVTGGNSPLPSIAQYRWFSSSGGTTYTGYIVPLLLFSIGLIAQGVAEPKLCVAQASCSYKIKLAAESLCVATRLVLLLGASLLKPQALESNPLLFAALAHAVYGLVYWATFEVTWWWRRRGISKAPQDTFGKVICALHQEGASAQAFSLISVSAMVMQLHSCASVWWQLFSESVVRLVLTEGEKFALAAMGTLTDQGVYDSVMNLGSLVARLIFRLWEETCFSRWAGIMAEGQGTQRASAWKESVQLLRSMLCVAIQVSIPLTIFGPPLAQTLLHTLYTQTWSGEIPVTVLSTLCWALPLMAVNGLLEAFIRATSCPAGLARTKWCMLITSTVYMLSCCVAIKLQPELAVVRLMQCLWAATAVRVVLSLVLIRMEERELGEGVVLEKDCLSLVAPHRLLHVGYWLGCGLLGGVARYLLLVPSLSSEVERSMLLSPYRVIVSAVLVVVYVLIAVLFDRPHGLLNSTCKKILTRRVKAKRE